MGLPRVGVVTLHAEALVITRVKNSLGIAVLFIVLELLKSDSGEVHEGHIVTQGMIMDKSMSQVGVVMMMGEVSSMSEAVVRAGMMGIEAV